MVNQNVKQIVYSIQSHKKVCYLMNDASRYMDRCSNAPEWQATRPACSSSLLEKTILLCHGKRGSKRSDAACASEQDSVIYIPRWRL